MDATPPRPRPWAGPAILLWALLAVLNWVGDPEHVRRMNLVQDAFRLWLEAPYSATGLVHVLPGHGRAAGVLLAGLLAAWLAGAPLARWLAVRGGPLRMGFGLGVGSLGMLGLGLTGLWFPPLFWCATVLFAAIQPARVLSGTGSSAVTPTPQRPTTQSPPPAQPGSGKTVQTRPPVAHGDALFPRWVWGSAMGLAGVSVAVNLLGALAPETGYDSLIQHLADPRDQLAAHRIWFNDLSFLAQHPAGLEMLYAWLLPAAGDRAARLLHAACGLFVAWAARDALRRWLAGRDAMVLACALYLTPFIGILSARSYIDLGLTFYAALILLAPWGSWAQGALVGLAIGTKYLGGFLLAGCVGALALAGAWRGIARVGAGAVLAGGWWGVRNWLNTGNPVYPFAWAALGGLGWDGHSAAEYGAELASYGAVAGRVGHGAIPWDALVHDHGALDDGSLGPLWLVLAGLAVTVPRDARGPGLPARLAAVTWCLWLASPRQVRYALMLLPPTLAAAAPLLRRAHARWPAGFGAAAAALPLVLAAQLVISFSALYVWVNPVYVVLGMDTPENYLAHIVEPRDEMTGRSNYLALAAWLPGTGRGGARTYMLGDAKVYYLPCRWAVNALFNPPLLKRVIAASRDGAGAARRLRQRGIGCVLYNTGGSMHIEYTHHLFAWSAREFAVVEDLFRTHFRPIGTRFTSVGEPQYLLYRVEAGAPAGGAWPEAPYLPGVDTRLAGVEDAAQHGRLAEARARAAALRHDFPGSHWLTGRLTAALRASVH